MNFTKKNTSQIGSKVGLNSKNTGFEPVTTNEFDEYKPGISKLIGRGTKKFTKFMPGENGESDLAAADKPMQMFSTLTFDQVKQRDIIDDRMGFERFVEGEPRLGWLVNIHDTLVDTGSCPEGNSAIDLYFLQDDGSSFKATILYEPYFYVFCLPGSESDVENYLRRKYSNFIKSVALVEKENLKLANHLVGIKCKALKLVFHNNEHFKSVKSRLFPTINENAKRKTSTSNTLDGMFDIGLPTTDSVSQNKARNAVEASVCIIELREHDISYYSRVMIDRDIRVGLWYNVRAVQGSIILEPRQDMTMRPDPVILAFDIETTKLPLRFPDSNFDCIIMISYMVDGQGYLITNREIVSRDIDDFDYNPKPEYQGEFTIFNEENEKALLMKFFDHIQTVRPTVFVTYNGDFFDWPFIEKRASIHNLNMAQEIGFSKNIAGEYLSSYASHMDCFCWVKRDSYLPQGSQNLKAVAKYKLGYDPVELDPEEMTKFASEEPQLLSQYSVSDAVATYYLYMKYVHPFTFSLCNIIPMHPDDVLRRGSGTLCEHLLMVQAFKANVIMPNKHVAKGGNFYNGHMLNGETYVGGHVEALEAGVFRNDIPTQFNLSSEAFQELIDQIDPALQFSIVEEGKHSLDSIVNYEEVRAKIVDALTLLRDEPDRLECPSIYHLDVSAMYPNIILTNRLQPDAIVDETTCATCDFNQGPDSDCQRKMPWSWRGEYFMATKSEYNMLRNQLEQEKFPGKKPEMPQRPFHELPHVEQELLLKKRMSEFTQKVYGKKFNAAVVEHESIVCQRENPFYVNTVRDFRDRRYEYKALLKQWKKKLENATDATAVYEASKMTVIYDSLQTAHKCILNSFYGYVMRKAARWYSMEMAGIVCLTGAKIIQLARQRVERIGRPLELDTDGIWCIIPQSFPENFTFTLKGGKTYAISYPCVMLNHLVHDQFTNHQYQELINPDTLEYSIRSENSIFFEVDGPYRAMILPASQEEGKLLKKRYAVFNLDGTIAELKGFELKRRGELKLIKNFQSSIFKVFLEGETLEECYQAVASVANRWLDILFSQGKEVSDAELLELVSENRSMSKTLLEYGAQKSTSITTAKRLAELLGEQMVQEKGLNCHFIITTKPFGAPVNERATPIAIFQSESTVKQHFLRKWLKDNTYDGEDIRDLIDWDYYKERFAGTVQKLITIPAALQKIDNPVPRLEHPAWVNRLLQRDVNKQRMITDMFAAAPRDSDASPTISKENTIVTRPVVPQVVRLPNGRRRLRSKEALLELKPVKLKKKASAKKKKSDILPLDDAIKFFEDYPSWISSQKVIWTNMLKRHKLVAVPKDGIGSFFSRSSSLMGNKTWELLQLSETDSQGIFRLWAIVNKNLESVDIEVPRIIFVNSRVEAVNVPPDVRAIKRVRTLPRNHQSHYLYEMRMSEYYYRKEAAAFAAFSNHADIEGVYETQVPLLFRALIQLGTFGESRIPNHLFDLSKPLDLDDIQVANRPREFYLQEGAVSPLLLFHASSSSRHFIAVFNPMSQSLNIYLVDVGLNKDSLPPVKRLYLEAKSKNEVINSTFFEFPEKVDSTVSVFATKKEVFVLLNRELLQAKKASAGKPVILVVQTASTLKYYRNSGIAAFREFPTMLVALHKSHSTFPALGWQKYVLEKMLEQIFYLPTFLDTRIGLARYANVPVCNLENDYDLFLSDLFFARRLKRVENVLWCSLSTRPDLGGSENEENTFYDLKCPEINIPSTSDTVCVELSIYDLPLNTIIRSHEYSGDFDQSAAANTSKGSIYLVDSHFAAKNSSEEVVHLNNSDQVSTHYAFLALRSMIKDWTKEVRNGDIHAGHMLDNFHRWLTTCSSLFYDALIVFQIHNMMKRALAMIVDEFRRLGSKVVYATFEKIIIVTSKSSLQAASGYLAYVTAAISRNPSFEHVELKNAVFYDYLVWYDYFNFGGLNYTNSSGTTDFTTLEDMEITISINWHISEFLPPAIRQSFLAVIAEYLDVVRQLRQVSNSEDISSSLAKYVDTEQKRQLLKIVKEIHRQKVLDPKDHTEDHSFSFPRLPGSSRPLTNPALEFIKMVTMVLGLHSALENEVRSLKKDLLRIIDIREFSKEAKFVTPCVNYVITQVICHYCNFGCDLDLTRRKEAEDSFLVCEKCFTSYNHDDIEQRLVFDLKGILTRWQMQDLRCKICRLVVAEELLDKCAKCTGQLETVLNREVFLDQVHVLANLAAYFRMPTLQEAAAFAKLYI